MLYKSLWVIGMRFVLLTVTLCCSLGPSPGLADIYVHYSNRTSMLFEDLPALFGSPLPKDGLMGVLVESRPLNACSPIAPPPLRNSSLTHFIVLIRRFDCNFDIKVLHAQRAGYSAAIVHNVNSDTLLRMGFSDERIALEIQIPSVFTSFSAAQILKSYIVPERGVYVILQPVFFLPIWYYLIPVSWIVGIILALLLAVLVVRCMQLRRRMRRSRMTREQLRKIPTHTFHKGDEYDICVICLDEYEEGDRLRVLPCSHAYHSQCVDPWLTRSKRTCPVCKQRVTHFTPDPSDSESDSENTPLLHPPAPSSPEPHPSAVTTTTEQRFGATSQHDTPLLAPSCPNGGTGSSSGSGSSEADSEGDGNAPLSSLDTVPLIHWGGAGM